MTDETQQQTFERGKKAGEVDTRLTGAEDQLSRVEAAVERAASATEALVGEVNKLVGLPTMVGALEVKLTTAIEEVKADVRDMKEAQRARDVKVESARVALAEDAERRRTVLEDAAATSDRSERQGDRRFSQTQQIVAMALAVTGLFVTVVGLYLAFGR